MGQRSSSQMIERRLSIEKANGKALGMVNDLAKTIEDKCIAIGMYPAFSRASMDSADNIMKQISLPELPIGDSFFADNLRYMSQTKQAEDFKNFQVFKIQAPPILTSSTKKVPQFKKEGFEPIVFNSLVNTISGQHSIEPINTPNPDDSPKKSDSERLIKQPFIQVYKTSRFDLGTDLAHLETQKQIPSSKIEKQGSQRYQGQQAGLGASRIKGQSKTVYGTSLSQKRPQTQMQRSQNDGNSSLDNQQVLKVKLYENNHLKSMESQRIIINHSPQLKPQSPKRSTTKTGLNFYPSNQTLVGYKEENVQQSFVLPLSRQNIFMTMSTEQIAQQSQSQMLIHRKKSIIYKKNSPVLNPRKIKASSIIQPRYISSHNDSNPLFGLNVASTSSLGINETSEVPISSQLIKVVQDYSYDGGVRQYVTQKPIITQNRQLDVFHATNREHQPIFIPTQNTKRPLEKSPQTIKVLQSPLVKPEDSSKNVKTLLQKLIQSHIKVMQGNENTAKNGMVKKNTPQFQQMTEARTLRLMEEKRLMSDIDHIIYNERGKRKGKK